MQYVITPATQGVCPTGWHIPTDVEWMTMEEALGMCTGAGAGCSGATGWRGTTQGDRLKRAYDCFGGDFCGISGFEALLAGNRGTDGLFYVSGSFTYLWSSTESVTNAWNRILHVSEARVVRSANSKFVGFSVRCVKD